MEKYQLKFYTPENTLSPFGGAKMVEWLEVALSFYPYFLNHDTF